jgi:hypothetical protein
MSEERGPRRENLQHLKGRDGKGDKEGLVQDVGGEPSENGSMGWTVSRKRGGP